MPSKYPEKWHLNVLFIVSTWLGLVAVFSSILLLYLGLNSHNENSFLAAIGVGDKMPYSEIQMMIYLVRPSTAAVPGGTRRGQRAWEGSEWGTGRRALTNERWVAAQFVRPAFVCNA